MINVRGEVMRITSIEVVKRFVLRLSFEDGTTEAVDLEEMSKKGVFKAWEQPGVFERVSIGSGGEASWECGVDLCADALYVRATGKTPSDLYPALGEDSRCA